MYKLLLCTRYLRTRYIALASIISVTLGVATMIVVNSVMSGFATEMRDRIKGILSDVVIETNGMDGEKNPEAMQQLIRKVCGDQIVAMTPTVEIYGILSFEYAGQWVTRPGTLVGIDPKTKSEVGPLIDYLQSYHPQKDGENRVRPAERELTEPPGWSLSPAAAAYRKEWSERAAWFREQAAMEELHRSRGERRFPSSGGLETANGETPEKRVVSVSESDDPQAGTAISQVAGADPFAGDMDGSHEQSPGRPEREIPLGTPLPARVYIGAGLVSYPHENETTGAIETVWMVRPGDDVKISTVTAGTPPQPAYFNATVIDTFKSKMSEYDSGLIFCNLEYLQQARRMIDPETGERAVTSIQLKLKDFHKAPEVVAKLKRVFPPGLFMVKTWEEKQGPLLQAVEVETRILNVLLFLIIAVAGFGILAIFFMIVVEKTRDIGILKALGASSSGVMSIFVSYGLALGSVGAGSGVIVGLLFVWNINTIEGWLTYITGKKVFDEQIYYFSSIPTKIDPLMVIWVAVGAVGIAVCASILPARRAACLQPVQALRND